MSDVMPSGSSPLPEADLPDLTTEQMREVDRIMVEELHVTLLQMMENAARHLASRGVDVEVVLSAAQAITDVPAHQLDILRRVSVPVVTALRVPELVLDAVLGYSISGDPRGRAGELIRWANAGDAPVLSLDAPSGLDLTSGRVGTPLHRRRGDPDTGAAQAWPPARARGGRGAVRGRHRRAALRVRAARHRRRRTLRGWDDPVRALIPGSHGQGDPQGRPPGRMRLSGPVEGFRGALPEDEKLTALLDVTREIAVNTGYVDDTTWKTALETGWSEKELLEGYAEVIRTIMTSYFNHLVGTDLDLPGAPPLD